MVETIADLMLELELPGLADITLEDPRLQHLVAASIVGLSDGDHIVLHEPLEDEVDKELFREVSYSDG